mmetsp:Transcript_25348/g.61049  ORF Transcript_25348/g.61049 Transcript_25348/m.61049 type:complete len:647 (-) Transcript_25348:437-2377(-)
MLTLGRLGRAKCGGRRKQALPLLAFLLLILFVCCLLEYFGSANSGVLAEGQVGLFTERKLLGHHRRILESDGDELENYPTDAFTASERKDGAIILHVMGMFYMFAGLAIICDEFFVPSLEVITDKLELQDDVAGATFMAAGGSAPELATSFVGTFVSKSNVGFGTIVGSAVFNILFVIGACAIAAKSELKLSSWPLARDSVCYAICLGVLIGCFFDKKIEPWEAAIMFFLYFLYVALMYYNGALKSLFERQLGYEPSRAENDIEMDEKKVPDALTPSLKKGLSESARSRKSARMHYGIHEFFAPHSRGRSRANSRTAASIDLKLKFKRVGKHVVRTIRANRTEETLTKDQSSKAHMSDIVLIAMAKPQVIHEGKAMDLPLLVSRNRSSNTREVRKVRQLRESRKRIENNSHSDNPILVEKEPTTQGETEMEKKKENSEKEESECEDHEDEPMDLEWPDTVPKQISYILLIPITYSLYYTVPDVRREGWREWYILTFGMSVGWIAGFSYFMVWWATAFGIAAGIPSEIMGLTILAIGTSVPDLFESILVTRDGKGDMAISSSLGSNIFDVTVGLPLPWLLYTIANAGAIEVGTNGLLISVALLFAMLVSVIIAIAASGWLLTKQLGIAFFVLWAIFVGISLIAEYLG